MKEFRQYRFSYLNNCKIIHGYHYKSLNLTQSNDVLGFSEGLSLLITTKWDYYNRLKFLIEDDICGFDVYYQNNEMLYKFYL